MDRILSWNVRGINSQHMQAAVKNLICSRGVGLVGLLETKIKASNLGALYLRVFSGWCFTSNNAWHDNGRIVVSWNPFMFNVDILQCSSQLIHLYVSSTSNKDSFHVTFVYGMNDEGGRNILWKELQELAVTSPWIVLGDFNDILSKEERIGARVKYKSSQAFQMCIAACYLEDIKYSGNFFTWNNKQKGQDRIYSKLDRILANQAWLNDFPVADVHFLNEGIFDHSPAILTVYPDLISGRKPFKYFRMWKSFSGFQELIHADCSRPVDGTMMYRVVQKLKRLKDTLRAINKQGFSDIHAAEMATYQSLTDCQNRLSKDPLNTNLIQEESDARQKYSEVQMEPGRRF
ncbi:uncharacterized protein LOC133832295 [Humulus lupulus]|uniref:uncharacterized protein LOC133832295 n=1 Tax=Humulus lupulus TaxID=3486 RepID=UPI002B402C8C|nr:uncharacterized protein LOC133832295 [Humulus lupulus]